jgi:hypothetical protein
MARIRVLCWGDIAGSRGINVVAIRLPLPG